MYDNPNMIKKMTTEQISDRILEMMENRVGATELDYEAYDGF